VDDNNSPARLIIGVVTIAVATPIIVAGFGLFKMIWPIIPILLTASAASRSNSSASYENNNNNKKGNFAQQRG
jgi:uncharacterized membrane protein